MMGWICARYSQGMSLPQLRLLRRHWAYRRFPFVRIDILGIESIDLVLEITCRCSQNLQNLRAELGIAFKLAK
jgi:hypothetical protein